MRFASQLAWSVVLAFASSGLARAQAVDCSVTHQAFVQGGVANAHMRLINKGNGCSFTFKFGGTFEPSDWKIEKAPRHGRLELGGSNLKYFPDARYSGPDEFTVAVFGSNPMLAHGRRSRDGRFAFQVDVRASP